MNFIIFYSWQSTHPTATNWSFIEDALNKACKRIDQDPKIDASPTIDRDTRGVPGSPPIPATILEKIDNSHAVIADVSLCCTAEDGERSPNPNVLYELGYAVARLGWERVVLVVNETYGKVEDLPFDLEKRRAITYRAEEGEADRSTAKEVLVGRLVTCISTMVFANKAVVEPTPSPKIQAIEAIENHHVSQIPRIRAFWTWLLEELEKVGPDLAAKNLHANGDIGGEIVSAYPSCLQCVSAFAEVASAAAIGPNGAVVEVWRGMEALLQKYDLPKGFTGSYNTRQFDYWKVVGYELCLVFVGALLRERNWGSIRDALSVSFIQERREETRSSGRADFRDFSEYPMSLYYWNEQNNPKFYSPVGSLLSVRYKSPPVNGALNWSTICDADVLLYLKGLATASKRKDGTEWIPNTYAYLSAVPRFVSEAVDPITADALRDILGCNSIAALKSSLKEYFAQLSEHCKSHYGRFRIAESAIEEIGSG
jgi:hypothetical protein